MNVVWVAQRSLSTVEAQVGSKTNNPHLKLARTL